MGDCFYSGTYSRKKMIRTLFIFMASVLLCSSESRNKSETQKNCPDHSQIVANDMTSLFLLNRINEQLSGATNIHENVMRKLEYINDRLIKMEVLKTETTVKIENIERGMDSLKHLIYSSNNMAANNIKSVTTNFLDDVSLKYSPNGGKLPYDCTDVLRMFGNKSGVYKIQPQHLLVPITVYCDHNIRGGGWTVIQSRTNGSLDFYRTWSEYKQGFGDPHGEYWLGLENIHLLTNQKINEVYFLMEDFNNDKAYAHYNGFLLGPESSNYQISFLGTYEGTAGDSFAGTKGLTFSTYDRDNDSWAQNCAKHYSGAWWNGGCFASNLNGNYTKGVLPKDQYAIGVIWNTYKGYYYSLKSSRIMVRPRIQQVTGI